MASTSRMFAVIALAVALLSACGGGDGGGSSSSPPPPTMQSGVLLDGAVQGVAYSSPSASGVTDASGTFQFASGETVAFCVGAFVSGVCQGLNLGSGGGRFLVRMFDLSSTTQSEQNKLRLLQALDQDNNLLNGITISPAVRTAAQGLSINFDQSTTTFTTAFSAISSSLASALGRTPTLPSATAAQFHAARSMACQITGIYRGHYTGANSSMDSGVFEAIIQPNGLIVIRGMSTRDQSRFSGIGSVPTSGNIGAFLLGTTSTNASFSGQVTASGISGTWNNTSVSPAQSGTFSGTKQTVSLPAGASGDVYRGVFSGDDMGSFVLAINSSNNISGTFYSASDNTTGLLNGNRTIGATTTLSGSFPGGTYTGTIRNDGNSVFLDGSWVSGSDSGYAMGCLVGSPSTTPIVPSVVSITPTASAATANNAFINSGTSSVTGGNGGTISRATLDRVTTQLQTSSNCCISGTFP